MKFIFASLFVLLISSQIFAQGSSPRIPDLKVGIGLPYVIGQSSREIQSVNDNHKIFGMPTLCIEKPFPLEYKRRNSFSVNPGLAYYMFLEEEVIGNTVVGKDINLNHHSLSGYVKAIAQAAIGTRRNEGIAYLGAVAGYHFITKTMGNKTIYSNNPDNPVDKFTVNEPGREFFNGLYYGALIGFQPKQKITNMIKPSIEVVFYPGMVQQKDDNASAIQLTVLLGFRQR